VARRTDAAATLRQPLPGRHDVDGHILFAQSIGLIERHHARAARARDPTVLRAQRQASSFEGRRQPSPPL